MSSHSEKKHWVVVPAAGSGKRMALDVPKQYLELLGSPILSHTLIRLNEGICPNGIIVALSDDDSRFESITKPICKIITVAGGQERCDSVLNGLAALADIAAEDDWVWVHDAARPCVQLKELHALKAALDNSHTGALLALKLVDTIKRSNAQQQVETTIDRNALWRALTPQVFQFKLLHQALVLALTKNIKVTDEAQAVELMGYQPSLVEGSMENIKITNAEDLGLAEFYLQRQSINVTGNVL